MEPVEFELEGVIKELPTFGAAFMPAGEAELMEVVFAPSDFGSSPQPDTATRVTRSAQPVDKFLAAPIKYFMKPPV